MSIIEEAKKVSLGPRTKRVSFKPKGGKEVHFTRHSKGIGAITHPKLRARAIAAAVLQKKVGTKAVSEGAAQLLRSNDAAIKRKLHKQ